MSAQNAAAAARAALPAADRPSHEGFRVSMRCSWSVEEGALVCSWRPELVLQRVTAAARGGAAST